MRAALVSLLFLASSNLVGGDLVRMVRYKLSAGDLASGEAAVEEYKRTTGADAEYLDAVGWLARGAQILGRREKAANYAGEVRRAISTEDPALLVPYGAAIEVEGRLRLEAEGRGAALHYWEAELARAKDPSLRSRIRKNMNLVSLEGEKAPEVGGAGPRLASFGGPGLSATQSTSIVPPSKPSRPTTARSTVVFPHPERPIRATREPRSTEAVTPFRTGVAPRESVRPRISRNGALI